MTVNTTATVKKGKIQVSAQDPISKAKLLATAKGAKISYKGDKAFKSLPKLAQDKMKACCVDAMKEYFTAHPQAVRGKR